MSAYRRECDFILEEGALPQEVDAAMRDYGFAMGIYAVQDLAGLDIAWAMRKRRAATRPADERYSRIADRLCELGRFGRKTGAGWFAYPSDGAKAGQPDPAVEQIIQEESARLGFTRRTFTDDEIMDRILSAMQAEARARARRGHRAQGLGHRRDDGQRLRLPALSRRTDVCSRLPGLKRSIHPRP